MNRSDAINTLGQRTDPWDVVVIGGGATGLGIAVDAATRGLSVALLEQRDFASGTSSRSTKLVHGGVRYLRQGNIGLVREALRERDRLRRNATHIVTDLPCVVPSYSRWDSLQYGIGLKLYDLLAGRQSIGRSSHLSLSRTIEALPEVRRDGLRGGTKYYDCQFDDARLAVALAQTAAAHGATIVNYAPVTGLLTDSSGTAIGVKARDRETEQLMDITAKVIINAGGPFADAVRSLGRPTTQPTLTLSRGSHIVLDRSFLSGTCALLVPRTADDRVMFMIPWQDVLLVGTTDVPVDRVDDDPAPQRQEITYLLETANRYLSRPASIGDIRSAFAGLRPLVRRDATSSTAVLSREHAIFVDETTKLITIAGGKWTTYRLMAQDVVDCAIEQGPLSAGPCVTATLPLCEASGDNRQTDHAADGAQRNAVAQADRSSPRIHPAAALTRGQVVNYCRTEMARTIDDVLSRRSRLLYTDARAAMEAAPAAARIMADELGRDETWIEQQVSAFMTVASKCIIDA